MAEPFNACPDCGGALLAFYVRNGERPAVELDVCRRCRGIWLDRGELEVALGRALKLEPLGGETSRHCARCRGPLQAVVTKGGVPLEQCPACLGLWADEGELSELGAKRADHAAAEAVLPRADFRCPKCQGRFPVTQGQGSALGLLCPSCTPQLATTPVLDKVEAVAGAFASARFGEPRFVGLADDVDSFLDLFDLD